MHDLHRFVKNRELFYIFATGFLISLGLACWTGWNDWVSSQQALHQPATWFGASGYLWSFGLVIFSNISSNLFGQSLVVILTAYFIYQRSAESRDEDDSVENLVEQIHKRVVGGSTSESGSRPYERGLMAYWNNYSLGILFVAGFLVFLILQTWTGWISYQAGQSSTHQSAAFGSFLVSSWGYNTWQNWQADLFGPAVQLVLAKHFIFKGSSQSKDGDERMKKMLSEALRRLPSQGTGASSRATISNSQDSDG